MNTSLHLITDPMDIKNYIYGEHALFTISNLDNTEHHTYKRYRPRRKRKANTSNQRIIYDYLNYDQSYKLLGEIDCRGRLIRTRRNTHNGWYESPSIDSPSFRVLSRCLEWINQNNFLPDGLFWHHNICSECGRILTEPESIQIGIGPICRGKMQLIEE
jgi:hypothetical protein